MLNDAPCPSCPSCPLASPGTVLDWSLSASVADTPLPQARCAVLAVLGWLMGACAGPRALLAPCTPACPHPPRLLPAHAAPPSLPRPATAPSHPQGGGLSHMVRFAGNAFAQRYRFWLDVPAGERIAAHLFVKHLEPSEPAKVRDWRGRALRACARLPCRLLRLCVPPPPTDCHRTLIAAPLSPPLPCHPCSGCCAACRTGRPPPQSPPSSHSTTSEATDLLTSGACHPVAGPSATRCRKAHASNAMCPLYSTPSKRYTQLLYLCIPYPQCRLSNRVHNGMHTHAR